MHGHVDVGSGTLHKRQLSLQATQEPLHCTAPGAGSTYTIQWNCTFTATDIQAVKEDVLSTKPGRAPYVHSRLTSPHRNRPARVSFLNASENYGEEDRQRRVGGGGGGVTNGQQGKKNPQSIGLPGSKN